MRKQLTQNTMTKKEALKIVLTEVEAHTHQFDTDPEYAEVIEAVKVLHGQK